MWDNYPSQEACKNNNTKPKILPAFLMPDESQPSSATVGAKKEI